LKLIDVGEFPLWGNFLWGILTTLPSWMKIALFEIIKEMTGQLETARFWVSFLTAAYIYSMSIIKLYPRHEEGTPST
jgi:hypothetical protein